MPGGPEKRISNPVSYGVRLDRRDLKLLRKLGAMRDRSVAQLLRDAIRPVIEEAEEKYGKSIPKAGE